jgi:hypothetical protein
MIGKAMTATAKVVKNEHNGSSHRDGRRSEVHPPHFENKITSKAYNGHR